MEEHRWSPLPERTLDSLAALSYRSGELQSFLDHACDAVLDLLGDGIAAITLYRDDRKHVLASKPDRERSQTQYATHGHLSTYVVDSGATLTVEDAHANTLYGDPPEGYCAYMGIPLRMPDGQIAGTLCYFDRDKRRFDDTEQRTAELFAERIAITLDNYQLYEKLKLHSRTLEDLVEQRTGELLAARDELARKEKLAAVGRFASQITHEIRNPLATIRLALEYIEKQPSITDNVQKRAALAAGESSRLEQLLTEVLHYARPQQLHPEPLELGAFLEDFVLTYESLAAGKQLGFRIAAPEPPNAQIFVLADGNKLTQVCLNLATNACEAAPHNGEVSWTLERDATTARISVYNKGDFIPAAKLHAITEAFVSGRPGGFGLGLAIVRSIVESHHGRLDIESSAENGTRISVILPLAEPGNAAENGVETNA